MTNWKEYKLGELCTITSSKRIFYKEYVSEGVPFFRSKEIIEKANGNDISTELFITKDKFQEIKDKFGVPLAGDILLTSVGTLGVSYQVQESDYFYFKDGNLTWFKDFSDEINTKFLLYWLRSPLGKEGFNSITIGSTQAALTIAGLKGIKLSIPDLPTQTAIAEILSSLDDKIELNNKINQELENLAQTLFKQWFIDFEFPNENGEPYKSSGGALVDSELGEIPKGWVVKSLDEVAEYLNGLALQKFPAQEGEDYLPVIKIRELRQGITQASDRASTEVPDKYIIQNGDVLFAWSGSLMIDFWTNGVGALNQHLFKVTSENYPKWFYFYWTKFHLDEFIKIAESKATTMGHIQRKHLTEAKVSVPNSKHLNQFNDNFENIVNAIISNREENQELTNLRDTLLPKLISGELEVADIMAEKA